MNMNKIPIIIDCDTGIDDMFSFVLTLFSDKLDIRGITTVSGNTYVDYTTFNTLNGLELMGRTEIPVARGEEKPLKRPFKDACEIHGNSGLGGYVFSHPTDKKVEEADAVEFMYKTLMESGKKITILAIAPLTNIAKLFIEHPDCREKIEKIVFMGGSICTGNPTPVATFNVWADPEAAREVFHGGVPLYLCPLNTTREAYMTEEEIAEIGNTENPVAQMLTSICSFYKKADEEQVNAKNRFKGMCVHDLCTAVYVTNPEYFTTKRYYGDVETKGELTTGFTMIDYEDILMKPEEEKNIYYIDSVNREGVIKEFFMALESYTK